jgi:hypothetical protein
MQWTGSLWARTVSDVPALGRSVVAVVPPRTWTSVARVRLVRFSVHYIEKIDGALPLFLMLLVHGLAENVSKIADIFCPMEANPPVHLTPSSATGSTARVSSTHTSSSTGSGEASPQVVDGPLWAPCGVVAGVDVCGMRVCVWCCAVYLSMLCCRCLGHAQCRVRVCALLETFLCCPVLFANVQCRLTLLIIA